MTRINHNSRTKAFLAASLTSLGLAITSPVCAQTAAPADTAGPAPAAADNANPGEAIVVSALRVPVELDRVSSSVTVIDLAEIERAQPVALTDILDRTPGITLTRNGGYGEVTGMRIRGADSGQTVVVIDGMRMADPTAIDGGFDFSQLFADDISRIEVLRGPQSILWGSDAIGGIVNVTTRTATRPLEEDFAVEAGSHQTVNAHAGIGGTSSLVDWRISGSTFSTEGIPTLAGGTSPNGYTRQAASATTTFHLADNVSLDVRGYWDNADNSYSDNYSLPVGIYAGDAGRSKQWSLYAGLNVALLDGRLKNRIAVLQDQTDNEDYDPVNLPPLTFIGHGRTRRFEYQGSFAVTSGVDLIYGAERAEQHMEVGSPYDAIAPYELTPYTASTNSIYGEARVSPVTGLTLNGGVRYDHHSQFGGNTVFSAGGAYTPDGGTTVIRASYDEGFKAPSLYQLYSDYGANNLQPERAKGWEVGAERSFLAKALTLSATWYERHTSNLIEFAYCPYEGALPSICYVPGTAISRYGYYANVDLAEAHGLELTGSAHFGPLFADANYSIVVAEDRTPGSDTFGQQLPHVPRHIANADLGATIAAGITASVAARWSGASIDSAFSPQINAGYVVIDARVEWKLSPALTFYGRVENLADRQYQTIYGYNSLGRTATIGLRSHF